MRNSWLLTRICLFQRFTECSRPCGGGVQSSTRECNSPPPANGGKYCTGPRIKYQSCNTYDCPPDSVDFRDEQCAAKNNNSYGIPGLGPNVKWVPKYGQSQHDECKLYCRVEKSNNYFLLEDKVSNLHWYEILGNADNANIVYFRSKTALSAVTIVSINAWMAFVDRLVATIN